MGHASNRLAGSGPAVDALNQVLQTMGVFLLKLNASRDSVAGFANIIDAAQSRDQLSPCAGGQNRVFRLRDENQQNTTALFQFMEPVNVPGHQRIEVAADDGGSGGGETGGLCGGDDLGPGVHSFIAHNAHVRAVRSNYYLSSCNAVSATRDASTRVMQRWSMGHSRFRQGLHSTGSRITRARGPVGPVVT